ncbi:unnamed protein product [Rotaria sordida]|uniref:Uncharacterized protein n=1 Tax=Rotaria sordida TaxID=392033 RepID=A0A814IW49_9BILA|nr:unnamed protein product [Rotaria sordida]
MACTNSANNRIVSIDVECMATGFTHEDRAPCSVALVDTHEAMVLLNIDLNAQNGHLATEDARASILLYLQYKDNARDLIDARRRLLNTRPRTTPAKANNYKYEGVCLSAYSANLCTCGRPIRGDD